MVIVGLKPVQYVAPKPPTDEEDDDHPWLGSGCLDLRWSRWIKTTTTDRKKKFRDEDSISIGRSFNFQQLKKATQNFHPNNMIGVGGFGRVYKGVLPNRMKIAVKQLISTTEKGKQAFLNEVGIISAMDDHPNLVKWLGCCEENNQLLLVYEYMENNSLYNALFGIGDFKWRLIINWDTRLEICLGIAKGLAFLHEQSALKIIHINIKPTNILLDKDLNTKISGFGSAIHHGDEEEALVAKVGGTSCYVAPEYAIHGLLTYKADVYSFGVVMLEILSGKSSTDYSPNDETAYLLDRAYVLYQQGNLLELMDPDLKMDYKVNQANRMLNLAILCTNQAPSIRPKMSEVVVSILKGKTELTSVPIIAPYSDDGFLKASASAEKSDALHETSCSIYDMTDANHEKRHLAGDDHADIQEYDFEDADSTMQVHDHHSLMDEEVEEEEDNNAGVPDNFDGGISSSKVNDDQSIGDQTLIEGGQKDDAKLLMERNFPVMAGPSESSNARKSGSSTIALFTDHHVTRMNEEEDKGELEYVEPTFDEDGKLCIEYLEKEFEEGCNEWKDSLVGFFVGDVKPLIMNTILNKENVETLWGVKGDDAVFVFSMEDDYFLIRFKYVEDKIKVLESGPWHIENRPLIIREWNWKLKFDKINEMKITLPIWVKMYNLPLFLWTPSYLSKVGSALGTPLYSDEKTKNKERVDFARLCIQVDASKSLPNSLNISIKDVNYEIRFEYEWKPLRCAKMEEMKQS